ncbi:MAG: hypothetical protein RIE24_19255 [Silicimonas sp.]
MVSLALGKDTRPTSDLINLTTDWGMSVSEATAQKTFARKGMAIAGFMVFSLASLMAIPILVGGVLFTASRGVMLEIGIVAGFVAVAVFFNAQSRKGPKNALQIDYQASEVRLGSTTTAGAFVRHKVCPLSAIHSVEVDTSDPANPALVVNLFSETATIRFNKADTSTLAALAEKIEAAANEARAAPIRTRIVSRINGFEAGVREMSHRVRSRINSSFA